MKNIKFIDTVKKISNSRYIIIPRFVREELEIMTGDRVKIIISKSEITKEELNLNENKE